MTFLSRKPKKSDDGQRAIDFLNEISKRFGNESNLFKLRDQPKKDIHIRLASSDNVKKILQAEISRTLSDDMVTGFSFLEEKLKSEINEQEADNKLLEEKFLVVCRENENCSKVLENLKIANQRLLKENALFFNDSIRHRYLKLKTHELNSTKDHLLCILESKRKKTQDIQAQLDKLLEELENLTKEREKAGMNAAHMSTKLNDLHMKCKSLDVLKEEQMHRRLLVSRFRQREGPIGVYLVTQATYSSSCVSFLSPQRIAIQNQTNGTKRRKPSIFQFNRVFKPNENLLLLFEDLRLHAVSALDGFNSAFVAYGQTGSGKTRTMFGTESQQGLVHYIMTELLNDSINRKAWSFAITCSALEAHGSGVYDIFSREPEPVPIIDDGLKLSMGRSIAELDLAVPEDIISALDKLKDCRTIGNSSRVLEHSTRRHLVVVVRVRGCDKANAKESTDGSIMFADLAGFEDVNQLVNFPRDVVNKAFTSNRSLNALGEVLMAVRKRKATIPFHRSPLTMLLKPCLMGEARFSLLLHSFTQVEEHHSIRKTMNFGANAISKKKGKGQRVVWKV